MLKPVSISFSVSLAVKKMIGVEFCKSLRNFSAILNPDIPSIMTSSRMRSYSSESIFKACSAEGAVVDRVAFAFEVELQDFS